MIYFALPIYNENENIRPLLERIAFVMARAGCDYRICAVDDGSTDGTARHLEELAARLPIRILTHQKNLNLGATIRDAILLALENARPEDVIVTLDADNSHDPSLVPQMAQLLAQGRDLAVASRYAAGGREVGLAFHRSVFSRVVNIALRSFCPIARVKDYTCGYRAYRASLLVEGIESYGNRLIEEEGFTCMAELLLKLRPLMQSAEEVPLVLRYDLKRGKSKMRVLRTILRYFHLFACFYLKPSVRRTLAVKH